MHSVSLSVLYQIACQPVLFHASSGIAGTYFVRAGLKTGRKFSNMRKLETAEPLVIDSLIARSKMRRAPVKVHPMKTRIQEDPSGRHFILSARDRTIRQYLGIICAASFALLLNGCASTRSYSDADPWHYNTSTGYPAVGAANWVSL